MTILFTKVVTMDKPELLFRLDAARERNIRLCDCLKVAACALKQIRGSGIPSTPWQQDAEKALVFIDKYYGIKDLITKGGNNE